MLFYIKLCLFLTIFRTELRCLIFDTSLSEGNLFLSEVVSEFKLIFSVCLKYKSTSDKFENLMRMFFRQNVSVLFQSDDEIFPIECKNLIFFEVHDTCICDSFSAAKQHYLTSYFSVIIVHSNDSFDVTEVENCAHVFDSANVVLVSLQCEEVYILSSPSLPRRVFHSQNYSLPMDSQDKDLQGQLVKVSTFHYPPFTIIETDNKSVRYRGMEMNLWQQIASHLNLTWSLVELDEPVPWGEVLDDGTVRGGVLGALQTARADIAFANIWQRSDYLSYVDFGPDNNKITLTFLVHRPHLLTDRWQSLLSIFHWLVWLFTLLGLLTVSIMYWIFSQLSVPAPVSPSQNIHYKQLLNE